MKPSKMTAVVWGKGKRSMAEGWCAIRARCFLLFFSRSVRRQRQILLLFPNKIKRQKIDKSCLQQRFALPLRHRFLLHLLSPNSLRRSLLLLDVFWRCAILFVYEISDDASANTLLRNVWNAREVLVLWWHPPRNFRVIFRKWRHLLTYKKSASPLSLASHNFKSEVWAQTATRHSLRS